MSERSDLLLQYSFALLPVQNLFIRIYLIVLSISSFVIEKNEKDILVIMLIQFEDWKVFEFF